MNAPGKLATKAFFYWNQNIKELSQASVAEVNVYPRRQQKILQKKKNSGNKMLRI